MPPKKEKNKKGFFSFFSKSKKKEKSNPVKSAETSILGTQELISNEALGQESISSRKRTVLLIGSTGKGKSTLANVLVDEKGEFKEIFAESNYGVSKTKEVNDKKFKLADGTEYLVVDTVGIGDTQLRKEEVLDKIAEAVYLVKEGVSQVFFVISKKFDQREMANYHLLSTIIFDKKVVDYTTIIRTHFEDFKNQAKWQADIDSMTKKDDELAKIIKSCQRIVYVDNPSLYLVRNDDEREEEAKERIERITKNRKELRSESRKVLIEHLKKELLEQKEDYKPQKLQKLSSEIAGYMEQKINKRKELEARKKKLGLEVKKKKKKKLEWLVILDRLNKLNIVLH